jgi:hypothetical protein
VKNPGHCSFALRKSLGRAGGKFHIDLSSAAVPKKFMSLFRIRRMFGLLADTSP